MNDWRSKPRTGKSQFLKHLPLIQARIEAGETQAAIRNDLCQDAGLQISAAQFSRYLKAFCPVVKARTEAIPQNSAEKVKPAKTSDQAKRLEQNSATTPRKPMTPADFRKIREDVDKLDLDALVSGRGLIYDEEQKS